MSVIQRKPPLKPEKTRLNFIRTLTDFSGDTVYMRNESCCGTMLLSSSKTGIIHSEESPDQETFDDRTCFGKKDQYAICDEICHGVQTVIQ